VVSLVDEVGVESAKSIFRVDQAESECYSAFARWAKPLSRLCGSSHSDKKSTVNPQVRPSNIICVIANLERDCPSNVFRSA